MSTSGLNEIVGTMQQETAQKTVWNDLLGWFPYADYPADTGIQIEFEPIILSNDEVIEIEKRIYDEKMQNNELQEFEGKYIAMLNGEIFDSDDEFQPLAKRVYDDAGYKVVFITRVIKSEKVHRMSPRFK